jgi:hypothetical protein
VVVLFLLGVQGKASESLPVAGGKLGLPQPRGFELLSRDSAWTALSFRSAKATTPVALEAGAVLASLTVQPQRGSLTAPSVRQKFVESLLEELRAEGKSLRAEVIEPAAVAEDPDLFVRVTDTIRASGRVSSRSKSARLVGGQLVVLYAVATHADAAQRKAMLASAETELLKRVVRAGIGAAAGGAAKPAEAVVAKEARVRFVPPPGYKTELTGAARGVVAVLTMEAFAERRIVVTVVPLEVPAGQTVNAEVIGTAADRAIELETERLSLPQPVGEWERAVDSRFVRRQRRMAGDDLNRFVTDSRQVRVGNAVVSVAMACPEDEEEETALAADAIAEGVGSGR